MALVSGTRLGPYEILAPLGAGGMGEVYRARDPRLGRDVAVKVLPDRLSKDPQALARFERETRAVAALSHPNILALYDVGSEHGVLFAVTELLEGETLRGRLARSAIPWRNAVEIGTAIAEGLAVAHSKGIIHRDLKPENVFLTSDGRLKILDFGLARWKPKPPTPIEAAATTETDAGTVMGTVGYMSPEQIRGIAADAPTDIFSLGCVLYEMVAGRRPFAHATAAETMSAALNEDPPNLADSGKELPLELQGIIHHCLEKNVEQRFQSARDLAFALRAAGKTGTAGVTPNLRGGPKRLDSLAVLPFVNAGGDPNTEYLSDGITENLINSLSQLPELRVVPRSRVFRYNGHEDPEKIGQKLNVRAVLMGRVVQRGESLNIQTELVDVAADSQLWGRQYIRKFSEIILVQEEIAKEVSEKLRLRPTGEEQKRLTKRYTENPEAHQLYLKGRYLWNRRTGETLRRAADYFQQAMEKDPGYALAWAGLADCYALFSAYSVLQPREAAPKAKEAASRALAFDDALAEPHAALGFVKTTYDWDWPGAEREFRRAIELNPNYATAHSWYSIYLEATARLDEAIAEAKLAQDADPLSLVASALAARTLYSARRYDEAIDLLCKTLDMDSNFYLSRVFLGMVYEKLARHEEAIAEFQKASSLFRGGPLALGALGHAYAVSGKKAEAQQVLAELKELSKQRYIAPFDIALTHAGLGDKPHALEWLERAYEDRSAWFGWIGFWPQLDSLRGEARFHDLVRRMGLEP